MLVIKLIFHTIFCVFVRYRSWNHNENIIIFADFAKLHLLTDICIVQKDDFSARILQKITILHHFETAQRCKIVNVQFWLNFKKVFHQATEPKYPRYSRILTKILSFCSILTFSFKAISHGTVA